MNKILFHHILCIGYDMQVTSCTSHNKALFLTCKLSGFCLQLWKVFICVISCDFTSSCNITVMLYFFLYHLVVHLVMIR